MDRLIKALFQVQEFKFHTDDDFVDRLHRRYTPSILVLFTILITVKQYVGNPIDCWCPAQFTSAQIDYTNTLCWVSNTYYVPFEEQMPLVDEPREHISYYQWVPILLLSQAALFFLPCTLWRFLNRRVGINLSAIVESAQSCQKAIYPETKEKTLRYMVMQVDAYLMRQRTSTKGRCSRLKQALAQHCCLFCGKFYGNYLTFMYLFTKVLYIVNIAGQLYILDVFLGMGHTYHLYGIKVLSKLFSGTDFSSMGRFPRVTLCDFEIRQKTNVHRYTVQCVLPINLFNEKIFLFTWFWLLWLALVTVVSLLHWLSRLAVLALQVPFVKRQLRAMDLHKKDTKLVKKFTEQYLRRDGLLVIRIVSSNAGALIAAELLHGLWANFGPEGRNLLEGLEREQAASDTGKHQRRLQEIV